MIRFVTHRNKKSIINLKISYYNHAAPIAGLLMLPHALPLTPMQLDRHTGTRPFRTVKRRLQDRTAYLGLTIVIRKGVQPAERERPAAPVDADVVATWVEFIAADAVDLGARAKVIAFAGVVFFAVGADPAVVGAFLEG